MDQLCHKINQLIQRVKSAPEGLDDELVHDIRVMTKQLRALAVLLRSFDKTVSAQITEKAKKLAGRLAGARDQQVMIETLQSLYRNYPDNNAYPQLINKLEQQREQQVVQLSNLQVIKKLSDYLPWLQQLSSSAFDATVIDSALYKMKKKVEKAYRRAIKTASNEQYHRWRKQSKYYYYQLKLFYPGRDKSHRVNLKLLNEQLGLLHDLDELRRYLKLHQQSCQDQIQSDIESEEKSLKSQIHTLAEKLLTPI